MSLTIAPDSRMHRGLLALIIAGCLLSTRAEPLTGSDILALAGNGDTLWLATSAGINFTIDTTAATPEWWGRELSSTAWPVAFGQGRALVCTDATSGENASRLSLLTYEHSRDSVTNLELSWNHETYRTFDNAQNLQPAYGCYAAVRTAHAWWLACLDGGLIRRNDSQTRVAVPGVDHKLYPLAGYPLPELQNRFTRNNARPVGVDRLTDNQTEGAAELVVSTPDRVWLFHEADTTWDSLANTLDSDRFELIEFDAVWAHPTADTATIFATAAVRTARDTSMYLLRYESARWVEVFGAGSGEGAPRGVSFALDRYMYVAHSSGVHLFDIGGPGAPVEIGSSDRFEQRMKTATGDVAWDVLTINDVLATTESDSTVTVWIGTSEGLFYARGEHPNSAATTPLAFTKRPLIIDNGVANIRAYPTLLNEEAPNGRVKFAYRLTKAARISIRIYDWNMDLVKVILNERRREAAPEGRTSAQPAEDFWDGTNESGRTVAPGVYYYRITTDQGGRAFGKIIVALAR